MSRGCIQVYTGDGKGKTTAAIGLAVRAAGAGLRVFIAQFMKRGDYGEIAGLRPLADRITVEQFGTGRFVRGAPDAEDLAAARAGLDRVRAVFAAGAHDLVILDEANVAAAVGVVPTAELLALLDLASGGDRGGPDRPRGPGRDPRAGGPGDRDAGRAALLPGRGPRAERDREVSAPCIAVFGTGSDVGKSIVVTALCRAILRRGIRVAPFKAQNMSNNSGVTPEGLEMGRAQIVQAEAARIAPQVDMNPVLLKPTSDLGSQVVVLGRVEGNSLAADYHRRKERLFGTAAAALARLRRAHELVVLEGAGSCAEVNLMAGDFVNLRMAEQAAAPVVLVADIHRGGVFAQIVGTLACLEPRQRDMIRGFIVNRFRGDLTLFADGVRWIEARTGRPVFGVLPWFTDIRIESEDSVAIENPPRVAGRGGRATPRLRSSACRTSPTSPTSSRCRRSRACGSTSSSARRTSGGFRAVILPGSKNTRHDLEWLQTSGWADAVRAHHRDGGHILGVCGGYQMLGARVHDPDGHEGRPGSTEGLGLLPVETVLQAPKTTTLTRFRWDGADGCGYEIHMGRTTRLGGTPGFRILERNGRAEADEDGCVSPDGRIVGTYLHGLFDAPAVTARWLAALGLDACGVPALGGLAARDREYDRLADHLEAHVDVGRILADCRVRRGQGVKGSSEQIHAMPFPHPRTLTPRTLPRGGCTHPELPNSGSEIESECWTNSPS